MDRVERGQVPAIITAKWQRDHYWRDERELVIEYFGPNRERLRASDGAAAIVRKRHQCPTN